MVKKANGFRIILVIIWMIVLGAYLRYEAYPAWFTRTIRGYRGLLPENLLTRDSWARISINDQPAGFIHTLFIMDDDQPEPVLEITTRMQMRVRILQTIQNIQLFSETLLDQDYEPQSFNISASSDDLSIRISGQNIGERKFEVTIDAGGRITKRTISIPPQTVLYNPAYEMALLQISPGRPMTIKTMDPISLQTANIIISAGNPETIVIEGKKIEALPRIATWQGLEFHSWIDQQGNFLKQVSPLGWTIEATTSEKALQTIAPDKPAPNLINSTIAAQTLFRLFLGPNAQ